MKPYDAKTEKDLMKLESDNFGATGAWAILHNGDHVSLHMPGGGWVSIPRKQFNAIVDWYMADQPVQS